MCLAGRLTSPSSETTDGNMSLSLTSSRLPSAARQASKGLARAAPTIAASRRNAPHEQMRSKSTQPAYEGHIPLNTFESAFLAVGSGLMALMNPRRGGALLSCSLRTVVIPCVQIWWLRWRKQRRREG